ncbi:MAG: hypothetical protein OEU32_11940 [Acidimicrobiia bacterium]|nr:hypothetical protein [Acidimicrobiia bacterium]
MTATLTDAPPSEAGPSIGDESPTEADAPTRAPLTLARLSTWTLGVALVIASVRTTIDPDLFWHIRTGEWILDNGIPKGDVFSFTVPGREWITHEWLSQVIAQLGFAAGGFVGVSLLFAALAIVAMVFTYKTIDGGPIQKALLTFFALQVTTIAWGARPQLFTLTFAAGFIWLVESVRRGERSERALLWLIPATLVWANLHSGFLLGVVILTTFAVGEYAQRRFLTADSSTLPASTVRLLWKVAAASFAIAVVNPSGPKLWIYPFITLRSGAMRTMISEWHSPDFHDAVFRPFMVLLIGGAIVLGASKRRPTVSQVLLFAGTTAAALTSLRHVALAGVVSIPVLSPHVTSAFAGTRLGPWLAGSKDRAFRVSRVFVGVVGAVLVLFSLMFVATTLGANDARIAEHYPEAAVDHLQEAGLADQHGYNAYGFGGYLIYRDVPVFVDGRADVYGDDFLWQVNTVNEAESGWDDVLDEYEVQWALVAPDDTEAAVLDASPGWTLEYEDSTAVIFVRAGS